MKILTKIVDKLHGKYGTKPVDNNTFFDGLRENPSGLQYMLDAQWLLQHRLGALPDVKDEKSRTAYIKEMSIHVNQEMNEMLYELAYFKPWSSKYDKWDRKKHEEQLAKVKEEYIDAWHFFMNIGIALELTEKEWLEIYNYKNCINHERQNNGY